MDRGCGAMLAAVLVLWGLSPLAAVVLPPIADGCAGALLAVGLGAGSALLLVGAGLGARLALGGRPPIVYYLDAPPRAPLITSWYKELP